MIGAIGGSSGFQARMMGGMQRPSKEQMLEHVFNKVDGNGDSGLDIDELTTMSQKIQERGGEGFNAEDILSEFDQDGDGILSQDEASGALESVGPKRGKGFPMPGAGGPPPGMMGGGPSPGKMGAGMQADVSSLEELLSESDEDGDGILDEYELGSFMEQLKEEISSSSSQGAWRSGQAINSYQNWNITVNVLEQSVFE